MFIFNAMPKNRQKHPFFRQNETIFRLIALDTLIDIKRNNYDLIIIIFILG